MHPYWSQNWGNAASQQHREGIRAAAAVNLAREQLASSLDVKPKQILFTSGATEANNLALLGYARAKAKLLKKKGHIITLQTEHHAVLDPLRQLQKEGFELTEIQPDSNGIVRPEQLIQAFREDTFLVSIMTANNEIGVIQEINEIAELCQERNITFHSDAAQAFGHIPIIFNSGGPDLMCISAHKVYGPKGIGALIIKPNIILEPLQWGGKQQAGLRPGTLPVPLIIGFAKAAELAQEDMTNRAKRLKDLRNELWKTLKTNNSDLLLNGCLKNRLPHNLNITVPNISGSKLHRELRPFVSCSSGSACSSGEPSHVLLSLGRSFKEASASLRLSLGRDTTITEINAAAEKINQVINQLKTAAN